MQILGHGVDIVSISRFRQSVDRQGESFLKKIFSPEEREYCTKKADPLPHYAARFAVKEAYSKALGLGLGRAGEMQEVSTTHDEKGAPHIHLQGRAQQVFMQSGGKQVFVSLSHDGDVALASVIIWGIAV